MGIGKPKLHTKLEVASFNRCKNIKGDPKNLGSFPSPWPRPLFSWCDFMMALGELKLVPKGTPLRQIWSNKLSDVCGRGVVLTLYGDEEKKYASIAIGKSMSSTTLRRYRDVVIN